MCAQYLRSSEEGMDALELEIEMFLSLHVGAKNQTWFLEEQRLLTTEPLL